VRSCVRPLLFSVARANQAWISKRVSEYLGGVEVVLRVLRVHAKREGRREGEEEGTGGPSTAPPRTPPTRLPMAGGSWASRARGSISSRGTAILGSTSRASIMCGRARRTASQLLPSRNVMKPNPLSTNHARGRSCVHRRSCVQCSCEFVHVYVLYYR